MCRRMNNRHLLIPSMLMLMLSALTVRLFAGNVKHEDKLSITAETLAVLIRANIAMTIFDARTGSHDDGRRIPGAIQMAPDASAGAIARHVTDKDRLIVVYCKDPLCPNFAVLSANLRRLGYRNVLEFPDGIVGWLKTFPAAEKSAGR